MGNFQFRTLLLLKKVGKQEKIREKQCSRNWVLLYDANPSERQPK